MKNYMNKTENNNVGNGQNTQLSCCDRYALLLYLTYVLLRLMNHSRPQFDHSLNWTTLGGCSQPQTKRVQL